MSAVTIEHLDKQISGLRGDVQELTAAVKLLATAVSFGADARIDHEQRIEALERHDHSHSNGSALGAESDI